MSRATTLWCFALLLVASVAAKKPVCDVKTEGDLVEYKSMADQCIVALKEQIVKEITASFKYLHCSTYFLKDTVNLPGFAKMFMEAASEEREHAKKLIDFYITRGGEDVKGLIPKSVIDEKEKCTSGTGALQLALKWEKDVTKSIKSVIKDCEDNIYDGYKDDHLIDYLSGDFLDEQYKGQKDISDKLSTLQRMQSQNGKNLAEFLFDKKILGDGLFD